MSCGGDCGCKGCSGDRHDADAHAIDWAIRSGRDGESLYWGANRFRASIEDSHGRGLVSDSMRESALGFSQEVASMPYSDSEFDWEFATASVSPGKDDDGGGGGAEPIGPDPLPPKNWTFEDYCEQNPKDWICCVLFPDKYCPDLWEDWCKKHPKDPECCKRFPDKYCPDPEPDPWERGRFNPNQWTLDDELEWAKRMAGIGNDLLYEWGLLRPTTGGGSWEDVGFLGLVTPVMRGFQQQMQAQAQVKKKTCCVDLVSKPAGRPVVEDKNQAGVTLDVTFVFAGFGKAGIGQRDCDCNCC